MIPASSQFKQGTLPGISVARQPLNLVPGDLISKVKANGIPEDTKAEQLAMWKTAGDIVSSYRPLGGDFHPGETAEDVWARKGQEASEGAPGNSRSRTTGETLAQSIKREGIRHPVTLQYKDVAESEGEDTPTIFGGHHRIAASLLDNPDNLVPVTYAPTMRHADTFYRRNRGEFNTGSGGTDQSNQHRRFIEENQD